MPRKPSQYQAIREEKKELIQEVALELFAHQGYPNTSIAEIAARAGISKGLMYNYFESKEALLISIMRNCMEKLTDNFDPNHDGLLEDHELVGYIHSIVDMVKQKPVFWKLYFSLFLQSPVMIILEREFSEPAQKMAEMMLNFFRRKGKNDPKTEVALFGAAMSGIMLKYIGSHGEYPIEKVRDRIIEIVLPQH